MRIIKTLKEKKHILLLCFVCCIVILPITFFGIPSGYDVPQHFKFAQSYQSSLLSEDGYPNWAGEENLGYGGIGIRFYPPLGYYALAASHFLTGNWYDAAWITFMFWMIVGSCGIYFCLRFWLNSTNSIIAAALYAIVPYHLHQIYITFNYAEFVAAAILPFCFAFCTRVYLRDKPVDILGLAVSYALLTLSHIPIALIGSVSIAIYGLTLSRRKTFVKTSIKATLGCLLGLTASSFYWITLLTEMKWLNHAQSKFSSGHYSYENNFYPLILRLSEESLHTVLVSDFSLILNLLFLSSGLIYLIVKNPEKEKSNRDAVKRFFMLGSFAFLMITPLSKPIWELIPIFQKIQFPSRWLVITVMCGVLATGFFIKYLRDTKILTKSRLAAYGISLFTCSLLFFLSMYVLQPAAFIPIERAEFNKQIAQLSEKESCFCWWSIWSKQKALEVKERVVVQDRSVKIIEWSKERRVIEIGDGKATRARIATFYYPHWKAFVNGEEVSVDKDDNGAIIIPLQSKSSVVKMVFKEPLLARISSYMSIIAWVVIFVLLLIKGLKICKLRNFENVATTRE